MGKVIKNPVGRQYMTPEGNYLLRSKRGEELHKIMAYARAGRISEDGSRLPCLIKRDGTWAGDCAWAVRMLLDRDMLERVETAPVVYRPTRTGLLCLIGAKSARNQVLDPEKLGREIDACPEVL